MFPSIAGVIRPVARYLIHRYMGEFLNTELNADQLELKLREGTASVQDVSLNVEHINTLLKEFGLVRIIQGFVQEIRAHVPWTRALEESTTILIKGLDLTFTPLQLIDVTNPQELVSSMFGSIVSSMSRSVEEIMQDEFEGDFNATDPNVEQFATIINQVVNRIKISFEEVTIRLDTEADISTGFEIRISRMEFVDEMLEASEQQRQSGPVTEQPTSLYTATDLNKLLHIEGVKFYTDLYSNFRPSSAASSQNDLTMDSVPSLDANQSLDASAFQSCYSQFNAQSSRKGSSVSGRSQINVPTTPIPFMVLCGERSTVRIRINNTALKAEGAFNKKMDVDFQVMGQAFAFITPSQLAILSDLFSKLTPSPPPPKPAHLSGGRPMGPEHYEKLTDHLQDDALVDQIIGQPTSNNAFFQSNNLAAAVEREIFYEIPSRTSHFNAPRSCSTEERLNKVHLFQQAPFEHRRHGSGSNVYGTTHAGSDGDSICDRGTQHGSNITLVERRPNVFSFTLRLPNLVAVVSHADPLSADAVARLRQTDPQAVLHQLKTLKDQADAFFASALKPAPLVLSGAPLDQQRQQYSALHPGDHLMLLSRSGIIRVTNEFEESKGGVFDLQCSFGQTDLCEYLTSDSVVGSESSIHLDLLNFVNREAPGQPSHLYGQPPLSADTDFTLRLTNADQVVKVEANMSACQTDLDPSIVDRISALLVRKPFYYNKNLLLTEEDPQFPTSSNFSDMFHSDEGLKDNFLMEQDQKDKVRFYCPRWDIDLRIPVADFSATSHSWEKRHVHKEHLKLRLDEAKLELPRFDIESLPTHALVNLYCNTVQGTFVGEPSTLGCHPDDMHFLYATGTGTNPADPISTQLVHIQVSFDARNKTLIMNNKPVGELMARSMYESYFQMNSDERPEGPFSKDGSYYMGTRLTQPGKLEELKEFASTAANLAKVNLCLNLPNLRLYLPSHDFLEVLYNRFANDFALFEPRSPLFKPNNKLDDLSGRSHRFHDFSNRFNDSYGSSNQFPNLDEEPNAVKETLLAFDLNVLKTKVLIQTVVEDEQTKPFYTQLGLELADARLFLVQGYMENPNLMYMFLTSNRSHLFHRNLLESQSLVRKVSEPNFCVRRSADTHVEPANANSEPAQSDGDDSLAVALKIHNNISENVREIVVAFAVRNSVFHLKPTVNPKHHFSQQFTDFFNLRDYGVPGYEWPKVSTTLHLNLRNLMVSYDHSQVVPESPMLAKLVIGSCNMFAAFLEQSETLRFQLLLENSLFYLAKKTAAEQRHARPLHFEDQRRSRSKDKVRHVKAARLGLLHLDLDYQPGNETEANAQPQLTVHLTNDDFVVWACADTIVEAANICTELLDSDHVRAFTSHAKPEEAAGGRDEPVFQATTSTHAPPLHATSSSSSLQWQKKTSVTTPNTLTPEQHERLVELMSQAMDEASPSTAVHLPPVVAQAAGRPSPRKRSSLTERKTSQSSVASAARDPILDEIQSAMQADVGDWNQTIFSELEPAPPPHSPVLEPCRSSDEDESPSVSPPDRARTGRFSDDEFVMIDEIVGSGITNAAGDPKVRVLEHDFEVVDNFLQVPDPGEINALVRLAPDNPPPLIKYEVKDLCVKLFVFGGNDFGDSPSPSRTYSMWDSRREDCERHESEGGPHRDHTVCVCANVHKVSFICELFNRDSPILSLNMFTIGDVEVKDHLLVSEINKLFYQFVSPTMPRRLAPLLSVRMVEDQAREGKLKVSLLPLRLNVDQDTLEFLQEFVASVQRDVRQPATPTDLDERLDLPVMEAGLGLHQDQRSEDSASCSSRKLSAESAYGSRRASNLYGTSPPQDELGVQWRKKPSDADLMRFDEEVTIKRAPNLDDLFNGSLNFNEEDHQPVPLRHRSKNPSVSSPLENDLLTGSIRPHFQLDAESNATPSVSNESQLTQTTERITVQTRDTFFKEFTFEPACIIRLDYVGKRVKTDQGALLGLLIGITSLKCTELTLKEVRNDRGLLGFNKCVQFAVDQWLNDIRTNQIPNVVGSYQPISSLVQIAQGVRDLFFIPLGEMRKEDGRVVLGLQKGATSFGISTATAAIDATQQIFSVIQGTAELAFDLVTPDLPYRDHRRPQQQQLAHHGHLVPSDIREGLHLAYDTVTSGVRETAFELSLAAREDRVQAGPPGELAAHPAYWWGRRLLRQMTPTAIRPIVIGSQATIQLLAGVKNQLRPDEHREEMDKWRQRLDPRQSSKRRR